MRIVIALIGAGLLGACGQGAGGNNAVANNAVSESGTSQPSGGAGGAASAMMQMQPGEWEITMTLPNGGSMPGTRICLTPEDVARGAAAMMSGGGRQAQGISCDYSRVTIAGGRIQGTSTCTQGEEMTVAVTMDGTMSPTEYAVSQRIRTTVRGQSRENQAHIIGRRVGECQAGQR